MVVIADSVEAELCKCINILFDDQFCERGQKAHLERAKEILETHPELEVKYRNQIIYDNGK